MAAKPFLARLGLISLVAGTAALPSVGVGAANTGFFDDAGALSASVNGVAGPRFVENAGEVDFFIPSVTNATGTADGSFHTEGGGSVLLDFYVGGSLSASKGQAGTQTLGVAQTLSAAELSVLIGDGSYCLRSDNVIIGNSAGTDRGSCAVVGMSAYGGGEGNTVMGRSASAGETGVRSAEAIGRDAYIDSGAGISMGYYAQSWYWNGSPRTEQGNIAIGPFAFATGDLLGGDELQGAVAMGWGSAAYGEGAIAIGQGAGSLSQSGTGYHQAQMNVDDASGLSVGDAIVSASDFFIQGTITNIAGSQIRYVPQHIGYVFEAGDTLTGGQTVVSQASPAFVATGGQSCSYSTLIGGYSGCDDGGGRESFIALGYGATAIQNNILQIGSNLATLVVVDLTGIAVGDSITDATTGATGTVLSTEVGTNLVQVRLTTNTAVFGPTNTVSGPGFSTTISAVVRNGSEGLIGTVQFGRGVEEISFNNPIGFQQGIRVQEAGAAATMGTATLAAGTVTVLTTAVTADSRIFLCQQTNAGGIDAVSVTARTPGVSFTISSANAASTDSIAWFIVEPAV